MIAESIQTNAFSIASLVLGPVELARPAWLAVGAGALVLVLLIARKSLAASVGASRRTAVGVRVVVVVLLAGALAEPSIREKSERLAVTAVIDTSRSIPTSVQADAERYIADAAAVDRDGSLDLLGAVTASREAIVQALPSAAATEVETQATGSADGTDLEEAVRIALAVRPDDAAYRLMLVSDGNETEGSLLAAAESARAMGVPIDVRPLTYRYDAEVVVEGVDTPATARTGEVINARVTLRATAPTRGRLFLLVGGDPVRLAPDEGGGSEELGIVVELDRGTNTLLVPLALSRRGPQEIEAVFEPIEQNAGDAIAENNRAASITFFSGEGRVLVLATRPEESFRLIGALESEGIGVDTTEPALGPASLIEFNAYDAVIVCNVPSYEFSERQLTALRAYVEDSGGGLVMTGGPDAFGAGGWIGTPVEDALPIQLDPPQSRRLPMGALAIVLDSSGSMFSPVAGAGATQMELAIEAAVAAVSTLSRLDEVAVVAFTGNYEMVVPLTRVENQQAVAQRLRRMGPGGGTNMFPAVEAAFDELLKSRAGVRHIIVLSDGQTMGSNEEGVRLAERIAAQGGSISTVSVGDAANDQLMNGMARAGGGNFHQVFGAGSKTRLPQIFIKEAQTVKRSLIWEGDPFQPATTGMPSEPMRGVTSVPSVSGYIVAADRQDGLAVVSLRGQESDPVLAQWQRGLGRVVTFTSDVTTRWASGWTAWEGFASFWGEHVRWAMRPQGDAQARTRIETDGNRSTLVLDLARTTGERINFATIIGRVAGPDGAARDITLRQDGPGRYVADFDTADPGSYVVALRYDTPATETHAATSGTLQSAVTRPFTDEFRALEDNAALLARVAERTGGRVLDADPRRADIWNRSGVTFPVAREPAFLAAIILVLAAFLIDVAVRRVRFDLALVRRVAGRALGRSATTAGSNIDSLKRAQARAQSRMSQQDSKDAMQKAREAAATKFEADATQTATEVALGDGPEAVIEAPVTRVDQPPQVGDDADAGLSRLMKAKKRAQSEMQDD
ncbi:MAG: VWA domain-containing protein [Planctomycetota bacterium]